MWDIFPPKQFFGIFYFRENFMLGSFLRTIIDYIYYKVVRHAN